ncbi:hypothetical protein SIN8267_02580 [Sinobacterium norvegicum]|uniref:DUF1254 domain-containing protein n=1 Tax=Sinobacterium norvegicum TaxID=1641715 RepID=A0ABM9AH33_9GAMM|nr:DUF1214 domain-containing protein [Sinobacterium norvegicum]CAH0992455.1 hypothetical protein SIN8267_02580 [Sinobacterium norvegicum]
MTFLSKKSVWATVIVLCIATAIAANNFNPAALISSQQRHNDEIIAEQLAEHIGAQAYVYGYPLVDMAKQMHNETHHVNDQQQVFAPVNRIYRFPEIVGPHNAGNIRLPNNDTLYLSGWFDISKEPLIIHTPDTNGRYFTIAVTNLYSEATHIGRRTHGTDEAYYALVTPHWQGELPIGVTRIEVESNQGWLLGRVLVDGEKDLAAAVTVMDGIWSASLSEFVPGQVPARPTAKKSEPINPMKSLAFFEHMNRALKHLPARANEAALMAQFDLIGVGPNSNFDIANLDEASKRGLQKGLAAGIAIVEAAEVRTIPSYNGWMSPSKVGRYGFDYIQRASVVANGYGNLPEESTYAATVTDTNNQMMSGDDVYTLHFDKGGLPPVNGFWSLTAYALPEKLVEQNAIDRYSFGDRTEGIRYNDDGSLTLWLQHEAPADKSKNWLPTPAGYFMTVMRMYEPGEAILNKQYQLSRIKMIE